MVDSLFLNPSMKSPLEMAAVSERVRQNYARRPEEFRAFLEVERLPTRTDEQMDVALVLFFNRRFQEGEGSSTANYTLGADGPRPVLFGRLGTRRTPRAWRCVRGWRKLCPVRSRLAFPFQVWAAIWSLAEGDLQPRPVVRLSSTGCSTEAPQVGLGSTFFEHRQALGSDHQHHGDRRCWEDENPLLEELTRGNKMDKVWN